MLTPQYFLCGGQRGDTLLELLITIVIVALGLLGFAGLETKVAVTEMESHQRAQALSLLTDMANRVRSNSANAASYVSAGTIGTGDGLTAACGTPPCTMADLDLFAWSNALKGSAETVTAAPATSASPSPKPVGAMVGARGCITQVQAPNTGAAICTPGIYQVTVVWQGMNQTVAPTNACGQGLYGNEALRRAVSVRIVVPLPSCS